MLRLSGDHATSLSEPLLKVICRGCALPSFGTIQVGIPTRRRLVFVPLNQATVGPGYLKVAYDRKQVKDAPSIDTDGELPAGDEEAVFKHYGLTYQPGANGERLLGRR